MPQSTTEPLDRPSSFRNWSALFALRPKSRPSTPRVLPVPPRASESDEETSSASSSHPSGFHFAGASDGPPSYAYAVSRSKPTSYRFVQESAFSMSLVTQEGPSTTAYNISVGVNVWMPSEHITLIRRHANPEGPVLARLEMGITSTNATVTIGDQAMSLNDLVPGIRSSSSSRRYLLSDGRVLRWKLCVTPWEASLDDSHLATFLPNSRDLTLQPRAHSHFDDIVISILILMREHLTPKSTQVGGAAGLFNYHPFSTSNE